MCAHVIALAQVKLLDSAARSQPGTNWWIKGDGCDLLAGLTESIRLEWSGDEDVDDGEVQKMYMAYRNQLDLIEGIGTDSRSDPPSIVEDLKKCLRAQIIDKEFLLKSKLMFKLYTLSCKHMKTRELVYTLMHTVNLGLLSCSKGVCRETREV